MVTIRLKCYIRKRAKQLGVEMPSNYRDILVKHTDRSNLSGNRIVFLSLLENDVINGSPMIPAFIAFNYEWATRLVLFDNEETQKAFAITVGHELTHKDGDISKLIIGKERRKFVSWVSEVHADFGAAQKMTNSKRQALLEAIEYKRNLQKNDCDTPSHPSWKKRGEYVANYNFTEELIHIIAKDTGCNDIKLINKAANFYKLIILN